MPPKPRSLEIIRLRGRSVPRGTGTGAGPGTTMEPCPDFFQIKCAICDLAKSAGIKGLPIFREL